MRLNHIAVVLVCFIGLTSVASHAQLTKNQCTNVPNDPGWITIHIFTDFTPPCSVIQNNWKTVEQIDTLPSQATLAACNDGSAIPSGWVITDFGTSASDCGRFTGDLESLFNTNGLPLGSTLTVCASSPIPSGWTITSTGTDFVRCGGTQGDLRSIRRDSGPDFTLSASPSSQTVARGNQGSYTVSINRVGGFVDAVNLTASTPLGVTVSFNPASTTGNASTMTLTVSSSAAAGQFSVGISGVSGVYNRSTTATLIVPRQWRTVDVTAAAGGPNAAAGNALKTQVDTIMTAVETYYIGADQHVRELAWTSSGGWISQDPSGLLGATPADAGSGLGTLVDNFNHAVEAYYVDTNHDVHELAFTAAQGWSINQDVSSVTGAPAAAAGSPVSTQVDTLNNAVEVYYIGTDRHVHEMAFVTGVGWGAPQDPTVLTGSPNAATGSPLATLVDTQNHAVELYYIDTNNHIREIPFVTGVGWTTPSDLTALTGDLPAAPATGLSVHLDTITNAVEVYYIATDQHVHELAFVTGQGWVVHQDVTGATNGQLVAAGSSIASHIDPLTNAVEVYYIGTDQHVHELAWTAANGWTTQDATSLAGAPNSAGATLTGMFDTINNQPVVFYVDTSLHVRQLFWN